MATLLLLYTLVILALVGIAIYEHITITNLSLPISPALTILAILLPLLAPLTTYTTIRLLSKSPLLLQPPPGSPPNPTTTTTTPTNHRRINRPNRNPNPTNPSNPLLSLLPHLAPLVPPTLHLLLTTVLTTLLASPLPTTSPVTSCLLTTHWTSLFRARRADAIRAIQDALTCCGLHTTRDMAWPFPPSGGDQGKEAARQCETHFGRHQPCLPVWEQALEKALAGEVGAVVGSGLVQVLGTLLVASVVVAAARRNTTAGGGGRGRRENGTAAGVLGWIIGGFGRRGAFARLEEDEAEEGRRGLLVPASVGEVQEEDSDEEEGRARHQEHRDEANATGEENGERRTLGYGTVGGGGTRVEPAHHVPERDPWARP
ncbi:hypothetical protein VTJ04DRAFT_9319 [Mycothermus thermophilus]|uniref:uncharacterized protein n=1 Tax=Humicola insolens TaxID=85995 RepID=UPI003742A6BF